LVAYTHPDTGQEYSPVDGSAIILAHLKEFKVLSKRAKNFQYIPADLMNFHTVWV